MDLELSDEQRLIVSTVRDFVRREILPRERELDPDADELPRDQYEPLVAKAKAMGLYCLIFRVIVSSVCHTARR